MGTLRTARLRALAAAATVGLLGLLGAGCDLFRPARPEVGGLGFHIVANYTSLDSVLYYMKVGIENKSSDGQAAYIGALADTNVDGVSFFAFFDPAVWVAYQGTKPDKWSLDQEVLFYGAFAKVRDEPYTMWWQTVDQYPDDPNEQTLSQARRVRHYQVYAHILATGDSLLIAVGYADLTFVHIGSRWKLSRWQDRVDPLIGFPPQNPLQQTFGARRLNATGG